MADGGRASFYGDGERCCAFVSVWGAAWVLSQPDLLYLGKISYGLYVLHEFAHFCAIRLVHASTPFMVLAQSIVGLALTILLAAASIAGWKARFCD